MTAQPSISVSREVPAPAARLFAVLVRPGAHPEVDGSGMLRATAGDQVVSGVGDVFVMNMHNDELGDYVMENRVVEFEPDRRIAWEPVMRSVEKPEFRHGIGQPAHYRWGWRLEPLDAGRTRVTEYFDCARSPEWLRTAVKDGERWRPAIEASLANLERVVAGT